MFTKSAEGDTLPGPRPEIARPEAGAGRSHLSADLKVVGNISSAGTVEVLGEVQGDIEAKALVIGSEGQVTGKVRAESLEVRGKLDGSAACRQAVLRSTAAAAVQVTYESLVIESGAEVEGKFKHASAKAAKG